MEVVSAKDELCRSSVIIQITAHSRSSAGFSIVLLVYNIDIFSVLGHKIRDFCQFRSCTLMPE